MPCLFFRERVVNMETYYDVLEVNDSASQEVIKAAYKALAKKYHPDSFKGETYECNNAMIKINEAYEVLSDTNKRKKYDEQIKYESNRSNIYDNQYSQKKENVKPDIKEEFHSNTKSESEKAQGSWFRKVLKDIGSEILTSIGNNNRDIENAYIEGLSMDDYLLVKRFKQSSGCKRVGYAKALEEKGLLVRDVDGKLVPSYNYRYLFG